MEIPLTPPSKEEFEEHARKLEAEMEASDKVRKQQMVLSLERELARINKELGNG